MKKLQQLREERADKLAASTALFEKAEKDGNRSLSDEEKAQVRTIRDEIKALDEDIELAEIAENQQRELAGSRGKSLNTHNTQEKRDLGSYSLMKAVRGVMAGGKLDGVELEMHQQAVHEARATGATVSGVGVPQMLLSTRDNSITQPTQPEDGSAVKAQDTVRPIIDLARPKSVLRELGATFLPGLVGDVGVPSFAQGAVSTFKGEIEELDKSNQKFAGAKLSPHRLGTWVRRSKQFLLQTSPAVEQMLRRDLELSIMQELERAAINGDGVDNEPLGILNTPGVLALALGANGGAPTRDMLIMLETLVEEQNLGMDTAGYLINVATKGKLKMTKVDEGSGLYLMNSNNELNGYPVRVSTNVPRNLTKGSTAATASAAIFGNWRNLLVGQWGGLDLTVDEITLAKKGQIEIIIQSFMDVLVQQAKSFAAVKDITTT